MATAPTSAPSTAQGDALTFIENELASYGLPASLASWAWGEIQAGRSNDRIMLDLQQTPEFKARFPAIALRQKAGLPAISPGEYVSYERQARQMMSAAGLPSGFYDSPADFTTLLANDVSTSELNQRIDTAKQATYNLPPEDAARLAHEFGLPPGSGGLTAFFLDPNKAMPLLQRDFQAAQIGGAADRTGYAALSDQTAQSLATQGVSADQAQSGFSQLARSSQLFGTLPGETGPGVTQQQQLGAVFGSNAADMQLIEQAKQRRLAAFGDSAQFASSSTGISGLGSVSQQP